MSNHTDQNVSVDARAAEEIEFGIGESSLGLVLVARSTQGICAVLFGDDRRALRRDLQHRFADATLADGDAQLGAIAAEVIAFI